MGENYKEVPRWAVGGDALDKVVQYQKERPEQYLSVFGKLKPRIVLEQFKLTNIFSKGLDEKSYIDERGSSADWDD